MTQQAFLTVREAASLLGISVRSVWRRIEQGLIAKHALDGSTRICRRDLDHYIKTRRLKAKKA